ncbi:MAG: lactonase family protein [Acidobacteriia bacterium]|nr:lactonase family protein [Terriglobia bacterium]
MKARSAAVALAASILLVSLILGCNGFFVDENTTVSFPVYVANSGVSSISAFKLDPSSGALSQATGSPFTSGTGPGALGTNSTGVFLYSANVGGGGTNGGVSGWTINADATLTAMNGSPFLSGASYSSLAVDPTARFVYAGASGSAAIQGFTITSATGVLTGMGGTVATVGNPLRMVEDPTGKFLFVAEGASGVEVFTIANGGALTHVQTVALGAANGIAVTAKYAYVADGATGVNAYSIDTTTGMLTPVGGALAAGTNPSNVAVSPNGAFVFVTNSGSNDVSAYTVTSSTGALTAVAGSPFAASTFPVAVAVDPSSRYVYVANQTAGSVSIFTIDTTTPGKLNSTGTTSTGTNPSDVLVVQ